MLAQGFDVTVWTDKKLKRKPDSFQITHRPFPQTLLSAKKALQETKLEKPFHYVIAGVEKSVVSAYWIRNIYKLKDHPFEVYLYCHDKLHMKRHLQKIGIPMTDFYFQTMGKQNLDGKKIWVVKHRKESGGFRTLFTKDKNIIQNHLEKGFLVEKFIQGTECSVESFVENGEIIFSNITNYFVKGKCNELPAKYEASLKKKLNSLNHKIIKSIGIEWGMTHAEFYILPDQTILFGEIALRPPGGYIMKLLANAYGFNPWGVFLNLQRKIPSTYVLKNNGYWSVVLLTSKAGKVKSIQGLTWAKENPNIVDLCVRPQAGDIVPARQRAGEDLGYMIMASATYKHLNQLTKKVLSKVLVKVGSTKS